MLGCGSKLAGHVEIGDYATVNGMTGIIQFVRLGRYSFIGATTKVTKDILPFMIAEGNPSSIRVVNTIGLERKGFAPERIRHIKDVIRHLFKAPSATAGRPRLTGHRISGRSGHHRDIRLCRPFTHWHSQDGLMRIGARRE